MENHSQGYVPDDVGFNDYMSGIDTAGWSETVDDEYTIPHTQPQDFNAHYAPPSQSQPTYDQTYSVPQNAYSNLSYNNNAYSHYQQERNIPSYSNASYGLDPALSDVYGSQASYTTFAPATNRTISPQNLHYGSTTIRQSSQSAPNHVSYGTTGMAASGVQTSPSFSFSQAQNLGHGYGDFATSSLQQTPNDATYATRGTLQTTQVQPSRINGQVNNATTQNKGSYGQSYSASNDLRFKQQQSVSRDNSTSDPNLVNMPQFQNAPFLRFAGTVQDVDQKPR